MAINLWARWKSLAAKDPLTIADVVQVVVPENRSLVQYPGGALAWLSGTSVAEGERAFTRAGKIEGQAPNLPLVVEEV